MLTNILLGLILAIVIGVFIILCSEIKGIKSTLNYIADYLPNIDRTNLTNSNHIEHLLDKFNKRALVDNEYFEIIKELIEKNKVELYNNQQLLYNIPVKLETFIAKENNTIRNEIKKQAKISFKTKLNPKTNKSINHK